MTVGLGPEGPRGWDGRALAVALLMAGGLGGCTTTRVSAPAPVEDRPIVRTAPTVVAPAPAPAPLPAAGTVEAAPQSSAVPADPNAGQPGYYTVKPGDTLIRIGLETGQNWRDIARWNQLEDPNRIEVGQVLRVIPPKAGAPAGKPPAGETVAAASEGGAASSPVGSAAVAAKPLPAAGSPAAAPAAASAPPPPAPAPAKAEAAGFVWPASGPVVAQFDGVKNKGIAIAGKAGDPVLAAADGTVIFAGAGIRGYGNMIIIQHGATYITAYAHNQTILVKEDQKVKQGQKIAEMGSSDADRVKLHFEIRRRPDGGKPVDPLKLLPPR